MPTLTLTPDLAAAIAESVAQGVPLETAAVAAGINRSVPYAWLQLADTGTWGNGHPAPEATRRAAIAFSEQIQRARAEWEAKQVAAISAAAQSVNEKTGIREWRAAAWLLNNHPVTRDAYKPAREVQVAGAVNHLVELQALQSASLPELERIIDLEAATPQLGAPEPAPAKPEPKPKRKPGLDRRRVR